MSQDPEPNVPGNGVPGSEIIPSASNSESNDPEDPSEDESAGLLPFPLVAIGGSAGGVEAAIDLFKNLPTDTGMAFVVLTHLAPNHKSHLKEILGSKTSLPVSEIVDQTRPEPNHVYVLPPKTFLTIHHGTLLLAPLPENQRLLVIDEFFRSLAADQKNRAIGVVLSGMDSDGALGLRAIKGEGGIAIVQAPETARFSSMPRSSIGIDHIDLIVPPADIGLELGRIASFYSLPNLHSLEQGQPPEGEEQQFSRLLRMLSSVSNIEFSGYKPGTLHRRIARRMLLRHFETLAEYLRYLQAHEEELNALHEDVLIGVTRFFRDGDVFSRLKSNIFPHILENRESGQQIRIWVAGCSTGEEAYSIAISLLEYLSGEQIEPPIQIFGTDASDFAIQRARTGLFPESIATDVSPDRLRRFFRKVDKGYQVAKRVRDLCIFARQNLCSDPPFGRLDLISCRNVMIYLGHDLQQQIMVTFHYALRSNGILLLGNSETISSRADLFTLTDHKHKIFTRNPAPTPLIPHPNRTFSLPETAIAGPGPSPADNWTDSDLHRTADRIVLARYGPPGVIVNKEFEILQSRGHTSFFLELLPGASSLHLARMLRESIAEQVMEALRRAVEQNAAVHVSDLVLRHGDERETVSLDVLPIYAPNENARCFLVLFPPSSAHSSQTSSQTNSRDKDRYITEINEDLASTRLHLQALLDDRDARNQELVSANEEIQSANEELQSSNEELETTKEELLSSNEELRTVNEQLQQRNVALTEAGNDLSNLLNSVNLPLLMLNNDLQIRQFTPLTQQLTSIRPSDIGRPINEIRLNLSIDNLEPILRDVLDTLGTRELEVRDCDGRWRLMRVRPYRTADNKIEGVVLLLMDIDDLRRTQESLRQARDYACTVIESIRTPIVVLDIDLKIRTVNTAFRSLTTFPLDGLQGRSFPELAQMLWSMDRLRPLLSALSLHDNDTFEFEHAFEEAAVKKVLRVWARALLADNSHVILITIEDISLEKHAEDLGTQLRQKLQAQVLLTEETLGRTQAELQALTNRLFTSQEEERRLVAAELHDDITQRLAHLQIELERLASNLPQDRVEMTDRIKTLSNETADLSHSVRDISHRLHPSIIEDLGLGEAIKQLVDEFRDHEGMPATFNRRNVPDAIPDKIAGVMYRITQEALRNVAKHAGQTHVKVALEGRDLGLHLEIRDLGEGFDFNDRGRGLGLIIMDERAKLVQGLFTVESSLGNGTTIRVDVPLIDRSSSDL